MLRRELMMLSERLGRAQMETAQLRAERDEMYGHIRDISSALRMGKGQFANSAREMLR